MNHNSQDTQKYYTNTALVFILSLFCFSEAEARQIILQHSKARFQIKGELLKFKDGAYIVQSSRFGKMTVNALNFKCIEGPCPVKTTAQQRKTNKNKLAITGSSTIGTDLLPSLIEAWADRKNSASKRVYTGKDHHLQIQLKKKTNGQITNINIHTNGSATAFPALAKGHADIGMSSRRINHTEINRFKRAGITNITHPYREHILALDGLQIIISPRNPVSSLSLKEVAQIYSGKIRNWSEVGGKKAKINVYTRDSKSGTYTIFKKIVLQPGKASISAKAQKKHTHQELSDAVARDPLAIGFTDIAYTRNAKTIAISTSCNAPQYPTSFAIKTEEYPLAFRMYLYTTGKSENPQTKDIIKFSMSDKAQQIIRHHGFIDQKLEKLPFSQQANRIVTAIASSRLDLDSRQINSFSQEFSNAERLSATFRFTKNSAILDNRSLKDLKRLASLLKSDKYKNKDIYLVGFTDSKGPAGKNTRISLKRADKVKNALLAAARGKILPYKVHVRGYGQLLPVACNNTAIGRWKNRRVEVWIK